MKSRNVSNGIPTQRISAVIHDARTQISNSPKSTAAKPARRQPLQPLKLPPIDENHTVSLGSESREDTENTTSKSGATQAQIDAYLRSVPTIEELKAQFKMEASHSENN